MKIGIIVAMDKELQQLQTLFDDGNVRVEKCGIGKVNAALGAQKMINEFHPDVLISSGCAGGNGDDVNVQDVVVSTELCYHDVYCGLAIDSTTQYGQVQGLPARFKADPFLLRKSLESVNSVELATAEGNEEGRMKNEEFATAEGVKATSAVANSTLSTLNSKLKDAAVANSQFSTLNSQLTQKIIPGLIVTGDWFVDSKEKMREIVGHFPEAKAVDMESCAIAQTCYINKVPFISFRIISDIPLRDTNASQYHNFWENMAERSFQVTKRFVESLL
jgi:adenosylhomocysteine nucleosidase